MEAYFSCGAGDFIAIESFMTEKQKRSIEKFWFFTIAGETIKKLIKLHSIWKDVKVVIPMKPKEIRKYNVYAFYNITHLRRRTRKGWPQLNGALDCSGDAIYPNIMNGTMKYRGSHFEPNWPGPHPHYEVVIDPESNSDDRLVKRGRNLTIAELNYIHGKHRRTSIAQVGINKTSLEAALTLVSNCEHFYGVDSMVSCWAARQPGIKSITVKTVNPIYRKWRPIYDPLKRIDIVDEIK